MREDNWNLKGKTLWDNRIEYYSKDDIETLSQKLIEDAYNNFGDGLSEKEQVDIFKSIINKRFGVNE